MLHGYEDGHSLIASSVDLQMEAARTILILSDMSGPSMQAGFESYITAYPIPMTSYYAVAKTWYAEEMDRPGCVWTHTLLIQINDLSRIHNLEVLLNHFLRPEKQGDLKYYKNPILLNVNKSKNESNIIGDYHFKNYEIEFLNKFLYSIYYKASNESSYFISDQPSKYEKLIFLIWSQQWPSLRSKFNFCTGSISNRKIHDNIFDFQIIPEETIRHIHREMPKAYFIEDNSLNSSPSYPDWVHIASKDIAANNNSKLRRVLWDVGEQTQGGRNDYSILVYISDCLISEDEIDDKLESIIFCLNELYPSPDKGKKIKNYLFGSKLLSIDNLTQPIDDIKLLSQLSTTNYH